MKRICLLLSLATISGSAWSLNLTDAIKSNQVSVDWTGANYSEVPENQKMDGFAPKMQMTVKNLTGRDLDLELDEGYMLEPAEKQYQAMLLTQVVATRLKPNEKQKRFIFAMCTQLSNSSPNTQTHYAVGKKAPDALLRLAKYIVANKLQSSAAQEAVWSLSDNSPILSISNPNEVVTESLQKFVADIKGVNLTQLKKDNEGKTYSDIISTFNGKKEDRNLTFKLDSTATVSAGYYSTSGELLKPIVDEVVLLDGKRSIRYNPFPISLTNQRYSVRLVKDGEIFREYYFRQ